jgi:hypothetical protein
VFSIVASRFRNTGPVAPYRGSASYSAHTTWPQISLPLFIRNVDGPRNSRPGGRWPVVAGPRVRNRCHSNSISCSRSQATRRPYLFLQPRKGGLVGAANLTESQNHYIVYLDSHQWQDVVLERIFIRIGGPEWAGDRAKGVKPDLRPMSRHSVPRWAMPIGSSQCMTTAWGC